MNRTGVVIGLIVFAATTQPATGYSIGTIGVDDYSSNGGGGSQLQVQVETANEAGSKARDYGWSWNFANNDTNSWGGLFANGGQDGVNTQDFVWYGGHGWHEGPFLGKGSSYSDCSTDWWSCQKTKTSNYRWSERTLKWIVGDSCEWLYDGVQTADGPNWNSGTYRLDRWDKAFNWSGGPPNGTLHMILSYRSASYDIQGVSRAFFNNALGSGKSARQSWFDAVWWEQFYWPGTPGIEPSVMCTYQTSTGASWSNESLKSPWPDPSCCGSLTKQFLAYYVGTPDFNY